MEKIEVITLPSFINPFMGIWFVSTAGGCLLQKKYSKNDLPDKDILTAFFQSQLQFVNTEFGDELEIIQVSAKKYFFYYLVGKYYAIIGMTKKKHANFGRISTMLSRIDELFYHYFADYLDFNCNPQQTAVFELFEPRLDEFFSKTVNLQVLAKKTATSGLKKIINILN